MPSGGPEIILPPGVIRPDFVARLRPETETLSIIYGATKSPKRRAFLRMMAKAEGIIFLPIDGGPENNTLDPPQIASRKNEHAISLLTASGEIKPDSRAQTVIIAADVQIHSSALTPDGRIVSITSGKPKKPSDVRKLFQGMIDSARATGDKRNYGYLIERGSEARVIIGTQTIRMEPKPEELSFFHIALEQEAVDFFATANGARQYFDELNKFLRSPQYLEGLEIEEPVSPTEICGALDLTVLGRRGAIHKINRTQRESADFGRVLDSALFAVHVGFHVSVLEQINPNAQNLIDRWPWRQRITDYATDAA